jgi:hypothetical protein
MQSELGQIYADVVLVLLSFLFLLPSLRFNNCLLANTVLRESCEEYLNMRKARVTSIKKDKSPEGKAALEVELAKMLKLKKIVGDKPAPKQVRMILFNANLVLFDFKKSILVLN